MEKAFLNDMLELVRKEMERLKNHEKELLHQLESTTLKPDGSNRRRAHQNSATSRAEKTITDILLASSKPMSPIEIVATSQKNGSNLKAPLVRQILSRSSGEKFHSPKRGLWELKKNQEK